MSKPARDELQQSLARLHAELAATPRVNETSRRLLRETLADIERVLNGSPSTELPRPKSASVPAGAATAAKSSPIDTAPHRLEQLAVDFEAAHPNLAASLRQFVDLLASMGL